MSGKKSVDGRSISEPAARIDILPVRGIGEIRPGDDLAAEIIANADWLADGDVLVVTSKIVSKAEGRLVQTRPGTDAEREDQRQRAIDDETLRVVARRGTLKIVETRQGLVMAAAGVDASNVARSEIALLPLDPDDSARRLRSAIAARTGLAVAVVISDSMGRPWRHGICDVAIGVAGLSAVIDERGSTDKFGNTLAMTEVAVADEVAAAADLVKGKLADIPVAVVRGLRYPDDGRGSKPLLRGSAGDLFWLGTAEALALGRAQAREQADQPDVSGLHADVLATLDAMVLDPGDGTGQSAVREGFFGLLAARPDATRRACVPGHVTASAIVLDHAGARVLLTLHRRIGAWVQLGGHLEDDDGSLMAAAQREAREEGGIAELVFDPMPMALDIHPITCSLGVPTRHFDVKFVARAPNGAEPVISSESVDLRWFALDDLPANIAPELPRLVCLAGRLLAGGPRAYTRLEQTT